MKVVIIDYGAGNLFSVGEALRRMGVEPVVTSDEAVIRSADRVLFPGVGHAADAMVQLCGSGLDRVIPALQQPVLGICLGMQLLCRSTTEGMVNGLGIFRSDVTEFSGQCIVPHTGWNDVRLSSGEVPFYFVHSYKAALCENTIGVCDYEAPFSAVLKRGNFLGAQFHPEKSGEAGERFLEQFLTNNF